MKPQTQDCAIKQKPIREQFGWHNRNCFDDEPSGWMLEGGEEAYFEALLIWEKNNITKNEEPEQHTVIGC